MFRQTQLFTYSATLLDALLKALTTVPTGALLATPSIELFTSQTQPTADSQYGDFTRATFLGYAIKTVALSAPSNLPGRNQCVQGSVDFIATSGPTFTPQTITGYVLTDGIGIYYGGELLAQPAPIAIAGDFLQLDVILPLLTMPPFGTN